MPEPADHYHHPAIDAVIDGMEAGERVMEHPPESAPIHGAVALLAALDAAGYDVVHRTPDTPTDELPHLATQRDVTVADLGEQEFFHTPDTPTDEPPASDAFLPPHMRQVRAAPDTPTDPDAAARARALIAAAMLGPLAYDGCFVLDGTTGDVLFECDSEQVAELIAAVPTLITDLLAERDAAVARADEMQTILCVLLDRSDGRTTITDAELAAVDRGRTLRSWRAEHDWSITIEAAAADRGTD